MTIASDVQVLAHNIVDPAALAAHTQDDRLKALSAAVLILSHAEIEHAIETACIATAQLLIASPEPRNAIIAWGLMESHSSLSIENIYKKRSSALHRLVDDYKNLVERNHGIKDKNLRSLLCPLGVDLTPLATDLSTLDLFGETRGQLAHSSLATWYTRDLPSKHVSAAVQAGRSADIIVEAIQAKHSQLPQGKARSIPIRRRIANAFRWVAAAIE